MILNKQNIVDPTYNNFQVMMAWEKPYMEKCVQYLKPFGDVLEIGFGMGYSATAINKYPLRSYTVIEKDKGVIKKFNQWKRKQKTKKINLIEGMWQFKLPLLLKKFDCIFFDDSPASEFKDYDKINRKLSFLKIILLNNVKYNTRLVAYSIAPDILSGYLTKHFTYKHYKINIKIPYYCKYARGNYMYVNKIKFRPVRV
tara:strand:- start:146 stop:742 length:597 start_codon:yes stop_codon:yes gene_type:complete